MSGGWLRSARWDAAWILAPAALPGLAAPFFPAGAGVGLAVWVLAVVAVDVAHVWSTLWRTWLNPAEAEARTGLLWAVPLAALVSTAAVQTIAPAQFWRILAYVAVFHFIRQTMGFSMLYRAAAGLPTRDLGACIERAALQGVCALAVLVWHVEGRPFDWFVSGDFVAPLPRAIVAPAAGLVAILVGTHLTLRLRSGRRNLGGDLWFLATATNWVGGVMLAQSDLGFTLANVLGHGVPYLALVWHTSRAGAPAPWSPSPALRRAGGAAVALFLGLPLGLAITEELLWDLAVWQERLPAVELPDGTVAVATAVLAVPQLTHYLLDGFIWRRAQPGPDRARSREGP